MAPPTDQEIDQSVANMLRFGVSLAAITVLAGGALLFAHPHHTVLNYRRFDAGNPALRTLVGVLRGAIDLSPLSVIQLGLLILIATPVARVVLCIVGFARQKKFLYVLISTTVLCILIYSLSSGGR